MRDLQSAHRYPAVPLVDCHITMQSGAPCTAIHINNGTIIWSQNGVGSQSEHPSTISVGSDGRLFTQTTNGVSGLDPVTGASPNADWPLPNSAGGGSVAIRYKSLPNGADALYFSIQNGQGAKAVRCVNAVTRATVRRCCHARFHRQSHTLSLPVSYPLVNRDSRCACSMADTALALPVAGLI
jgi:hypothetical protein